MRNSVFLAVIAALVLAILMGQHQARKIERLERQYEELWEVFDETASEKGEARRKCATLENIIRMLLNDIEPGEPTPWADHRDA